MTIILYAIPGFFLLIALELVLEKVRKTNYYRVNDAISSLSAGVLSRMVGIFKNLVPFTLYILAYENLALFSLSDSAWMWVVAFVAYDFFYYWNHRFGHEVSLFWASHVVHHSSEDYNLSTALRQSSGGFFGFVFYLPMAVIGFSPAMWVTVAALNLVYQFWVHTQHLGKLGWLEWVMITPSNHRVHHAQNDIYLDRNYGGVFIIWDRLFGSFQEELAEEKPIFGVRKALHSWNPFWANLQIYSQLVKDSIRTKRWLDKLRVWFGRTGWRPDDVAQQYPITPVDLANFERFDTDITMSAKVYAVLQYILTAMIAVMLMIHAGNLSVTIQLGVASFVILSCVNLAWFTENRSSAYSFEWMKHAIILIAMLIFSLPQWLVLCLTLGSMASILVLFKARLSLKVQKHAQNSDIEQIAG